MSEPLRTPPPSPPVTAKAEHTDVETKSKTAVVNVEKQLSTSGLPKPDQAMVTDRHCSKCHEFMVIPYQGSCGHRFHHHCALDLIKNNKPCPVKNCEDKYVEDCFQDRSRHKTYNQYDWSEWMENEEPKESKLPPQPQGELISDADYEFQRLNIDKNQVPESAPISSSEHSTTPNVVDGWQDLATPSAPPQTGHERHICPTCASRLQSKTQCDHPDNSATRAGPGIAGRSLQEEHEAGLRELLSIEYSSACEFKARLPQVHDGGAEQLWTYLNEQPEGFVGALFNLHFDDQLIPFNEILIDTLEHLKNDQSVFVAFSFTHRGDSYTIPIQFYRQPNQDDQKGQLSMICSVAIPRASGRLLTFKAQSTKELVSYLLNMLILSNAGETAIFELNNNHIALRTPDQFYTFMLPNKCLDTYPPCSVTESNPGEMYHAYSRILGLTVHGNQPPKITANIVRHRQQNAKDDCMLLVEFCEHDLAVDDTVGGHVDLANTIPAGSMVSEDVLASLLRANHNTVLDDLHLKLQNSKRTIARIDLRVGTSAEHELFYLIANNNSYFLVPYSNEQIKTVSTQDWSQMRAYLEYLLRGHNVEQVIIELYRKQAPPAEKT